MGHVWAAALMVGEVLFVGALMLILPRITRRGLLFGVYVGERAWGEDCSTDLVRRYTLGGVAWMTVCAVAGVSLTSIGLLSTVGTLLLLPSPVLLGFVVLYLWAHSQSRHMAARGGPLPAAAVLLPGRSDGTTLGAAALAFCLCCSAFAILYAWAHYDQLPARVPTHFGLFGEPDHWAAKSRRGVITLPITGLGFGIVFGCLAMLSARAKRSIRYPAAAISASSQERFRLAMTRYLAACAVVTCGSGALLSVGTVNVGLGMWPRLPVPWLLTGLILATAVGGALVLIFRHGQGGARLEQGTGMASLTNGLADNDHWVFGEFYFNREDPAILIEARFGIGYTLNLGNWKAVAVLVGILGLLVLAHFTG
jgi:uncharacterized membrane protein